MKNIIRVPVIVGTILAVAPFMAFAEHGAQEGSGVIDAPVVVEESCAIEHNLTIGSTGEAVRCLQEHLIEDGLLSVASPTSFFGEMTKAAVMKWQEEKKLPATGFFGSLSRAAFGGPHEEEEKHEEAEAPHSESVALHPKLDVTAWPSAPSVSIKLHPDAMSGHNLEITAQNFKFAPEHVNGAVLPNEGHAHVNINGKKISRIYGNWFHLPKELFPTKGDHEVTVSLNANDHSGLMLGTTTVEAKTKITVN